MKLLITLIFCFLFPQFFSYPTNNRSPLSYYKGKMDCIICLIISTSILAQPGSRNIDETINETCTNMFFLDHLCFELFREHKDSLNTLTMEHYTGQRAEDACLGLLLCSSSDYKKIANVKNYTALQIPHTNSEPKHRLPCAVCRWHSMYGCLLVLTG